MRYAILTFAFAFFVSFVPAKPQTPGEPNKTASPESTRQYFPIGVFEQNPQLSAYKERWYASFLAAMEEPSLLEAAKNGEITTYRFLLVFSTRALSVRLALHADGTGALSGKLVILHSDKPNTNFSKDVVPVPVEQVQKFLTLLQKADFWTLKAEPINDKNRYAVDGTQWVLEGARNHSYHVVERFSPKETDYKQVCSHLISLSPLKLDEDARNKNGP